MNFDKLEKFLLLEKTVERLDSTGLTRIKEDSERWFSSFNEYCETRKLTPIERIMKIVLIFVDDRLCDYFYIHDTPIIFSDAQKQIESYRADFLVSSKLFGAKYVIECDGHDFHEKTKEQAKYDKQRDRFFTNKGYKVLRYSGSEIYNDFYKIIDELYNVFQKEIEGGNND